MISCVHLYGPRLPYNRSKTLARPVSMVPIAVEEEDRSLSVLLLLFIRSLAFI